MKPLCFVLMPFGRKQDGTGRLIDFDTVYQQIIQPAVTAAGLEPIRADEEQVGGTIHKPMYERLMLCEFAVADVTGANPNVYYELGIRHAVRPSSTVILFAEGTSLPFDIALLRGLPYRLDASGNPANPEGDKQNIMQRLRTANEEPHDDSPLFTLIQDMPRIEVDHEKTDLFRDRVTYSREAKQRLSVARKAGADAVGQRSRGIPQPSQCRSRNRGGLISFLSCRQSLAADGGPLRSYVAHPAKHPHGAGAARLRSQPARKV
jgi:hypothetical protein